MDQKQTTRYVSRFEPLLYVLAFTRKDFYYIHIGPSTMGLSLRNYNSTIGVHYSSLKHNHLYTRGIGTKPNHNLLYTRGISHKVKNQIQSPLHKRDKHKAKTQPQSPKLNHNHLYTRGIGTKLKQRRDYKLGDHNRPQIIFLTKIRSYR